MAYAKNKYSSHIHSKTRFLSHSKTPAQKVTFIVIIIAIIVVAIALVCSLILNPEHTTKSTISKLATEYYEEYFYPNISTDDISKTMSKYANSGFSKIPLSQLLLYNNQQNASYQPSLTKYCDENTTYIQFFPTEPFGKTDYRIEYTYSCNF